MNFAVGFHWCCRVRVAATAAYELPARPEDDKGRLFMCNIHKTEASPDCLRENVLISEPTKCMCSRGSFLQNNFASGLVPGVVQHGSDRFKRGHCSYCKGVWLQHCCPGDPAAFY